MKKIINKEIKFAILSAALKDENKLEDGTVNWNYVEADLFIDLGNKYSSERLLDAITISANEYYATLNARLAKEAK